ncbi:glycosyltransferase family 2 protein [Rubricoccus marinus]|uniref:Glycosyltransferase 2-like domain-containing protein n=1 Tax=Rubricoccus marinus TaxID=716817 RepID=A0A259TYL6_9BACT|nr:glycosyltransferase family 2 protein [Rubricoccus marinus]OZC02786.1 hypothetical protein BSZ36_07245 [Rubricoccus marinus]
MTIVVPVLNGEHVLPLTTDAVLRQPIERIVYVDDGSTDRTPALLRDLAALDSRVEVITFPSNRGRAAARNAGASGARGLLLFLDADVSPGSGYAESMAAAVESDCVIAAVGSLRFPAREGSDPYHRYLASSRRGVAAAPVRDDGSVSWRYFLAGIAAVEAAALHRAGGFPESIRYGEDLALACLLARDHPQGLAHAPEATADLYDVGTLETARTKLAAFACDLGAVLDVCPDALTVAGLERLANPSVFNRLALKAAAWQLPATLCTAAIHSLPGSIQPLAVRYLLGHTLVANARLDGHPRTS